MCFPSVSLSPRVSLSLLVSPSQSPGAASPAPPPRAVGVTLQPAGLSRQLTPRFLAPGWVPAAAEHASLALARSPTPHLCALPSPAPRAHNFFFEADLAGPGMGRDGPRPRPKVPRANPAARPVRRLCLPRATPAHSPECGADHEGQQRPRGCAAHAAPPPQAAGINSGREAAGPGGG